MPRYIAEYLVRGYVCKTFDATNPEDAAIIAREMESEEFRFTHLDEIDYVEINTVEPIEGEEEESDYA